LSTTGECDKNVKITNYLTAFTYTITEDSYDSSRNKIHSEYAKDHYYETASM